MAGGDGKASASGDGASQPATTAGRSFPGAGGEPAPAGDDEDDNPFNFDDLDASLDAIHRASDARPAVDKSTAAEPPLVRDANKLAPTDAGSSTAAAAGDEEGASLAAAPAPGQAAPPPPGGLLAGAAHLPCFYLYAETDGASASGRPAGKSAQQAAAAAGPVLARAPGEAWDGSEESRDDAAAWAGEAWEEDAVLRPGAVDAVFLKFSKTLTRCPDQCARYRCVPGSLRAGGSPFFLVWGCGERGPSVCLVELVSFRSGGGWGVSARDGPLPSAAAPRIHGPASEAPAHAGLHSGAPRFRGVLEWPEPTLPTAPPCPACGAERCLEVQLMSPALVAMAEARAWSALLPPALAELPGSWDWITVAVFTCSAACAGKAGPGVFEEHVATAVDA